LEKWCPQNENYRKYIVLVNLKEELTEIENKKSKSLTNPPHPQLKADGARKPLHNAYR
jgi:hypothetical protein